MNSKYAFFGLVGAITALLLLTLGVAYKGSALLQQEGDKLMDLKVRTEVIEDRKAALVRAERDIEQYSELETIAKSIVPQEKDQARTVREIVTIAQETGIPLASIQFPASALGEVKKGAKSKTPVANPATSQLEPVEGIKGLFAMEVTVTSDNQQPVAYDQLLGFLEQLEQNRRTAHVTNLNIQPSKENRNLVTFTVILNVYIKP